jgi:hypothetical protein
VRELGAELLLTGPGLAEMASQTQGIQQLLGAEKRAAEKVQHCLVIIALSSCWHRAQWTVPTIEPHVHLVHHGQ